MWLALQDKVLVRIYQIGQPQFSIPCVSRSCCLLQRSSHWRLACSKILGHLSLPANFGGLGGRCCYYDRGSDCRKLAVHLDVTQPSIFTGRCRFDK
jgi:hypothetical protein